ncbi:thioredoxin family protein [Algoriphagus sp. CAU 1675]|uniref:thioredoxin family protein n=1 Tax=Algoriphagus sp. CAU 1675 TaxID=3032597 RepID=UPI0023DC7321|nr:thioredoxin family protein [Algoriphagus sp. CAU 1675]MDF2158383.1 thioredoxin family protein [Algoriphagus sp. CAU 1675]
MLDHQLELISPELIQSAQTYPEYRDMVIRLASENKTTGPNQSESYVGYTQMGAQRMKRWDKTSKVGPEMTELVKSLPPHYWLVLTEAWCGDAAQTIPYMNKLTELNPGIEMRLILRDENPEVMDAYLTNGARSIPKLIAFSKDLRREFFTWGPKPQFLLDRQKAYKLDPKGISPQEFTEGTHLWYARDKNQSLEKELYQLIQEASNS